ncbi:MAG: YcjF family protein [Actinobacteria bacterium]|nr:YcjF family protein [Actinomycetota bacterium]
MTDRVIEGTAGRSDLWRGARRLALLGAVLVLVVFTVFVVNQVAQVVDLADRTSPVLGDIVLWALVAVLAALVLAPLVLYLRLPAPLRPPATDEGPEFEEHLAALRKRLARNPHVDGSPQTRAEIEEALATLAGLADAAARAEAGRVFLSTAISQSGRLDTFVVLGANLRLVYRIARIYLQRPTLRDMTYLYGNVAATAFVAGEIDDLDISEQMEPIIASTFGGMAGMVPGLGVAANVLTASVLSGATNAYLALRIGHIARRYCGSLVIADRRGIRRSASAAAAGSLAQIVASGSGRLVKAMGKATASRATGAVSGLFRRGRRDEEADPHTPGAGPE